MKSVYLVVTAMVSNAEAAHALVLNLADACVKAEDVRVEYRVGGRAWAWPDALPSEEDLALAAGPVLRFASPTARGLADGLTAEDLGEPSHPKGYTASDVRRALKG